jgi:hypothetical protein
MLRVAWQACRWRYWQCGKAMEKEIRVVGRAEVVGAWRSFQRWRCRHGFTSRSSAVVVVCICEAKGGDGEAGGGLSGGIESLSRAQ